MMLKKHKYCMGTFKFGGKYGRISGHFLFWRLSENVPARCCQRIWTTLHYQKPKCAIKENKKTSVTGETHNGQKNVHAVSKVCVCVYIYIHLYLCVCIVDIHVCMCLCVYHSIVGCIMFLCIVLIGIIYYIRLYYIILYYIILYYIKLYYIISYYIILYYVILYFIILYYIILYFCALY